MLALVVATLLDRWFSRRGHKFAEAVTRGQVSPVLDTRLRFIRRLIYASILLIGIAVALSQFTGLSNLAKSILASGALAAAIIGFAARQTLANVVAGIMLAITQPLRVGDWVTFEEQYGVVEDVLEGCTGWRYVSEELAAAGVGVHLGDPAEIAALRGPKKRAKTDRADARLLRTLLLEGRFPESWIPPAHVLEIRSLGRLYCTLMDERRAWQQRIHAQLFHQGCPPIGRCCRRRAATALAGAELSAAGTPVRGHRAAAHR